MKTMHYLAKAIAVGAIWWAAAYTAISLNDADGLFFSAMVGTALVCWLL
jgi:hypothetical protein